MNIYLLPVWLLTGVNMKIPRAFNFKQLLKNAFFWWGIIVAILVWVIDPVFDSAFPGEGAIPGQLSNPAPHEIIFRSIISGLVLIFSAICGIFYVRYRNAEHELGQEKQIFTDTAQIAKFGSWTWNIRNKRIQWSDNLYTILDFDRQRIESSLKNLFRIVHPDDLPDLKKQIFSKQKYRAPTVSEFRIIKKDKSISVIQYHAVMEFDVDGKPARLMGTAQDITEQKQLEEIGSNLGRILEESLNEIYVFDADSLKFEMVNLGARKNLGYTLDELKQLTPLDIKPEFNRETFNELIAPLKNGDKNKISFETIHKRKDGSTYPVEVHLQLLSYNGRPAYTAMIFDLSELRKSEATLAESESRFRNIFDNAPQGIALVDHNGVIVDCNPRSIESLGYKPAELIGQSISAITHPDDIESSLKMFRQVMAGEIPNYTLEKRYRHKDGRYIWCKISASPFRGKEGRVLYAIVHVEDISEQKRAAEEIHRLTLSVDSSPIVVIITDKTGIIEYVNRKFTEVTGYSRDEVIGKKPNILATKETTHDVYQKLWSTILAGKEWRGELLNRKKTGKRYWASEVIFPISNDKGDITHFVSLHEDITESKKISEQLSYQATHDMLTGLINRNEFDRRLERVLLSIQDNFVEHALCYMDLDQFKVINDTCGHIAGDELLRTLSGILQKRIRKRDSLARLGGDEFAVLMEHCTLDQARKVAGELIKDIREFRFNWEGKSFSIGISIGLVPIVQGDSVTEILKRADIACYAAKDAGRNRIHEYLPEDEITSQRHVEMQWVSQINQALEENRFQLYVQAIESLNKKDITNHYEFLLRMNLDGKLISPGQFLPAAERYFMVSKIDRWVIKTVFNLFAENPEFLSSTYLCTLNLSGQSVAEPDFLNYVIHRLKEFSLPGDKFCFEITETAAISNLANASKFIHCIKEFGCKFALDDFGSGLSSFGYLKTLPVDYLKIDGIFVKDIVDDPIDFAMVKSIHDIGHVMGKLTIAEYVENNAIKKKLKEIGVDYAQGFAISKPCAVEKLLSYPKQGIRQSL